MRRVYVSGVVLALLAVACGQTAPERGPLPKPPDQLSFPAPTTTVIPQDGTCVVTTGVGLRIDELTEGFEAASVLALGDVIIAIDGVPVSNRSTLLAALEGRSPGDRIEVGYLRGGAEASATLTLGAAPDDPNRGMIGVVVRDAVEVTRLEDIPSGVAEPDRLLVEFDGGLYSLDVSANAWVALPGPPPESRIVQIGTDLMATAPDGTGLVALDGSTGYRLSTEQFSFVAALGVLGDGLVYSVAQTDESGAIVGSSVVSADLETGTVLWTRRLPPVDGTFPLPIVGYPDPSGAFIAVTHQHDSGPLHTLYAADGTPTMGLGSAGVDLARGAVLAGWIDERSLVASGGDGEGNLLAVVIDVRDVSVDPEVFEFDVEDPISVYAVTGTSGLLVGTSTGTTIFDLDQRTFESITANCGLEVLGSTR